MRAEDLRIGNYVQLGIFIEAIDVYDLLDIVSDNFIVCNPIPLTEEWLLKFKFPVDSLIHVGYNGNDFLRGEMSVAYGSEYIRKIKYVHQLQNLYFALTGEELTIKN